MSELSAILKDSTHNLQSSLNLSLLWTQMVSKKKNYSASPPYIHFFMIYPFFSECTFVQNPLSFPLVCLTRNQFSDTWQFSLERVCLGAENSIIGNLKPYSNIVISCNNFLKTMFYITAFCYSLDCQIFCLTVAARK